MVLCAIKMSSNNSVKTNVRYKKLVYSIGSVFCTTPWYDFEKDDLKNPFLNKIFAVMSGLFVGSIIITAMVMKPERSFENVFEKVLSTLNVTISFCLMECLIFGSAFVKQKKWQQLLTKFSEFYQLTEKNPECKMCASFYLQFILGHIYFVATFLYGGYKFVSDMGLCGIFQMTYMMIPEYYCFLNAMTSSSFVLGIKCFYEDLNMRLKKQTDCYSLECREKRCEEKYVNNILAIGKCYRSLSELVQYYNDIFGTLTFLTFWHAIVQILRCAHLTLRLTDDIHIPWSIFLWFMIIFLLSLGESVYIILCCEKASSAGRKMDQLCHKLQESFDIQSVAREELFKLAETVRSHKPKFTAANFFIINQGTILKIVNIATTYLIVIIQFYSTVRERHLKENSEEIKKN